MASLASVSPSEWITTQQAAEALGVTERTIRRMCEERKLGSQVRREKGRKPFRVVNASDLERLIGSQVKPILVTSVEPREKPTEVGPHVPPEAAALQHFLAGVLQAFPIQRPKPWLTLDEAVEFSGLPKAWLLAQARRREYGVEIRRESCVEAINVGTEKRASWRFSRAALSR